MIADRFNELKVNVHDDEPLIGQQQENTETLEHVKQYDIIQKGVETIKRNVVEINKLKQVDSETANEKTRKTNMDNMNSVVAETNGIGRQIKSQFNLIQSQNVEYQRKHKGEVAKIQMRNNLYQTHIRRFHHIMNEYKSTTQEFQQNLQERTKRQLKIVQSDISDEKADKIVASGQAHAVIKQALISDNISDVIRDIEERHASIINLEQQVLDVFQLFQDLDTLVDQQQENLDVIESRIEKAKAYAEKAEEELIIATVYQRKSRKRCCCVLILLLAVMLVILIPILGTILSNA